MNRTSLRALLLATPFLVLWPGLPAHSSLAAAPTVPLLAPSQISFRILPNGVRSIVKSSGGSDLVNIQVWVKAGSRFETERKVAPLTFSKPWRYAARKIPGQRQRGRRRRRTGRHPRPGRRWRLLDFA